ncbi:MAG: hypothetical protein IJE79_01765 [Alphaproteobacteria bacterium]|nr:hypothetical protein [Alphaproteobacteria bacterium]
MYNINKILFTVLLSMVVSPVCAGTLLRGDANISITSDTALNAKNIAFDEARRQVLYDVLQQYADKDALKQVIKTAPTAKVAGLVSSSGIVDEKTSSTTYSAKISIVFEETAVQAWLAENNVQNWLPDTSKQDSFSVIVELSDKLPQWIELNNIARSENIKIQPQKISGNNINIVVPTESRGAFTIALRERGWKYTDQDGILRIWKKK